MINNIRLYKYKNDKEISRRKKIHIFTFLSNEEKKRINRLKFKKDKEARAISRYLLRKILSECLKIDAKTIKLVNDKYDRPILVLPKIKNFHFNVSHSGDYIVIAISSNGRVGIDIEKIKPINLSVSDTCFTKNEIKYLYNKKGTEIERFYKLWTLKESFVKAIGEGLSYPLKKFNFKLKDGLIKHKINNKASRWRFKMYNIDKGYKVSLCIKTGEFPKYFKKIDYL